MTIQDINALVGKFVNTTWMRVCTVIGILFIFWISPFIIKHRNNTYEAQEWYEKGMTYYNNRQFNEAITWFEQSANRGNSDAQKMLVKAKQAEAQEWYEKGMSYYNNRQFNQAAVWLENSADRGNLQAQEMLGYENGQKPSTSHISFETVLHWKANYERGGY